MKEFMFLVRGKDAISPEELSKRLGAYESWMHNLVSKGKFREGQPLQDASTLVISETEALTEGYFSRAKELVSGYLIIKANDFAEAVSIAKSCPLIEQFPIEVREMKIR
ncbi:MAG: hypothetical protein JST75_04790 [Bacteroidetes bacterium]|nr:hypothetical protein [Bacteroidota bacterium]